mmetsp:Transcript_13683/g.24642  ORF Transcript_13683/g.24642 Transcript_13683/m.24642 type:complete len:228 (-) Transcript_13683:468-1151(-)|eukprot:CAMPEP_0206380654 /NCGR_PEP_ID=MMETSP0294-20121207/12156_1 /ASSEMBLY_ACC=CAM_ASM_000327 /TAXON_ID=39354 /ORGANISM="Heterosigma akashiwo, Strain CCMP2393" /LENGTH=227 /DNA_ID=CAMNT_0053829911 /DNA_START=51 /DNA_END=734 /DNA_ORIENTATION=+
MSLTNILGRALRETGQALDRLGMRYMGVENFYDHFSRHRQLMPIGDDKNPAVAPNTFVAPSASVIGSVNLAEGSSVWYNAVIRADVGSVSVGRNSNIQDRTVIQASVGGGDVVIEDNVTVGHAAVIYPSTIKSGSLVGIGAIIGKGATVGESAMVAAGAVVAAGTQIPPKQLWAGNPAKAVRDLKADELPGLEKSAALYSGYAAEHRAEFLPYGAPYLDTEKAGASL